LGCERNPALSAGASASGWSECPRGRDRTLVGDVDERPLIVLSTRSVTLTLFHKAPFWDSVSRRPHKAQTSRTSS